MYQRRKSFFISPSTNMFVSPLINHIFNMFLFSLVVKIEYVEWWWRHQHQPPAMILIDFTKGGWRY